MAGQTTRQAQFRLPMWVNDYLEQLAIRTGRTKTDVVIEAVACLRERNQAESMEVGYREQAALSTDIAEEAIAVASEVLDEW
jgi:predicted DNA-binding protein